MKVPVTRDRDNDTELIMLDLNDVIFIQTEDRTLVYHTLDEVYYPLIPSLTTLSKHTEHLGFRRLDRINLVNIQKVKYFDEDLGKVYFEENITKHSKFTTVSFINKNKLKKEINEWINKNL
jgi:DNA-binding LytR/AlgR family response regulator